MIILANPFTEHRIHYHRVKIKIMFASALPRKIRLIVCLQTYFWDTTKYRIDFRRSKTILAMEWIQSAFSDNIQYWIYGYESIIDFVQCDRVYSVVLYFCRFNQWLIRRHLPNDTNQHLLSPLCVCQIFVIIKCIAQHVYRVQSDRHSNRIIFGCCCCCCCFYCFDIEIQQSFLSENQCAFPFRKYTYSVQQFRRLHIFTYVCKWNFNLLSEIERKTESIRK